MRGTYRLINKLHIYVHKTTFYVFLYVHLNHFNEQWMCWKYRNGIERVEKYLIVKNYAKQLMSNFNCYEKNILEF